jgi:hypothetical protein
MSGVLINPGTGDVRQWGRVSLRWAIANIHALVTDVGVSGCHIKRLPKRDGEGRFGFELRYGRRKYAIDMPGCARARVRSWPVVNVCAPRLYIDGHSFWWKYVVELLEERV